MNILFVASEVAPFAKTGGLADVSGALPKALKDLGDEVKVVMPRYYGINRDTLEKVPLVLGVDMGSLGEMWCGVYKGFLPGSSVEIYFIEHEGFYGRSGLYDEDNIAYEDNDKRFAFFSKAALQLAKALNFKPDIIHANDWHSAAIPILLKTVYKDDIFFNNVKSVLTIHNLQHQGVFDKSIMDILGIEWIHFNPYALEALGAVNLLKGGITFCDAVTTVSQKYAKEIQTDEYGFGLQEHIRAFSYKLFGILNGVDYDEWSPEKDRYIFKNYSVDTLEDKIENKRELQRIFDLVPSDEIALIGFVGRFAKQKGIELISSCIEGLLQLDIQLVMLGSGEKWAESFFSEIANRYPERFGCYVGYNNELAHKIEAGSDMFLMPSLFEPCGLNQIYSLRYATLPIVRATGGLDDTIVNYDRFNDRGNGFKFYEASAHALYHTVRWAVEVYEEEKEQFVKMQKRAMREHFSWMDSAKKYQEVYEWVKG
jgi:starch synthase